MFKLILLLLSLSAYPMKVIIVDGKAFATHSDAQQIFPKTLYPSSTAMLITANDLNVMGAPSAATPTAPMTEAEIRATMTPEQQALSDLEYQGVNNTSVTAAMASTFILEPVSAEVQSMKKILSDTAKKYKMSIYQILNYKGK